MLHHATPPARRFLAHVFVAMLLLLGGNLALSPALQAQQRIRIATYNIRFLNTNVANTDRLNNLQEVVNELNANVIGLQEIDDRDALELVFPSNEWHHIIDDNSGSNQDVAAVVRKPLEVVGFPQDLDADNEHFLVPGSSENSFFPNRRDVLVVGVTTPSHADTFFVMVVHTKSRFESGVGPGRSINDPRRVGHGRRVVERLREDFEGKKVILLGDFNDNPDDESVNILETGNPNAQGGAEDDQGTFLVNLTEPLCAAGHVSIGVEFDDLDAQTGRLNTIDPNSRQRNNDGRGTNLNTGKILFDQILISPGMLDRHISGTTRVFDHRSAVQGSSPASDHLPVFADFIIDLGEVLDEEEDDVALSTARLFSLLPNPTGTDAGREEITIENAGDTALDLEGWMARDRSNRIFALSGVIPPRARLTFVMVNATMPLTNSGDTVFLINRDGEVVDEVSYERIEARSGITITFE